LSEWGGVNLDNSSFCEGVCSDEFIVGRMVGDDNDADFASDALRAPGEVARFETESAEFSVASSSADEMDTFGTDTGVGWLTALFEGSGKSIS
jgi:hypothetical protein